MGTGDRTPVSVLHVDDDADLVETAARFLEDEVDGLCVVTATSAADGLDLLEERDVDCVVSDYELSDADGFDFLDRVREEYPDLPFVLFTGKGSEEIASEAIRRGVTDYLRKGVAPEQYTVLANRIENAVAAHRAERAARTTRERYEKLIEHASDVIFVVDEEGEFSYLSPAVERLLGYAPEELVGENGFEYVHPDDREATRREFTRVVDDPGYTAATEFRARHADGSWVTFEIRGRNRLDDPHIEGIVVVGRDVTDRRAHERRIERLHEATRELMAAETREEVARVASETVRNLLGFPLNAVYLHDPDTDALVPAAVTEPVDDVIGDPPVIRAGEGVAWTAYETGESQIYGDVREAPEVLNPETSIRSEFHLPIGDHGVLVAGSTESDDFDDSDRTLAKVLTANVEVAMDRTEQERERARTVQRLEAVIEASPNAIVVSDTDGIVERWNPAAERMFGWDAEAVRGERIPIVPEDKEAEFRDHRARMSDGESIHGVETQRLTASGERIDVSVSAAPIQDPDGEITGSMAVFEDITDRKERQRLLERRTAAVEGLHEATRELMRADSPRDVAGTVTDAAADILDLRHTTVHLYDEESGALVPVAWTDRAEDTLGRPPRLGEGSLAWRVFERDETLIEDDLRTVEELHNPETDLRSEIIVPLDDHGTVTIASTRTGAFDETDRRLVELLCTNATAALDRVRREQTLRRRERALERENERLDQFATLVSHDLRTPLNTATGRLELARSEDDDEHLDHAERALDRMEALITDMLTLAREGETVDEFETVDLASVAERSWDAVGNDSATLVVETDANARADPDRLRQVFENLLRNAVEHGGDTVTVTVGDLDDGFYVEDDGPGIPAEERGDVFDAGYRTGDGTTGFGLTIVEQIVDAHGWSIRAVEGSEGGARFEITGVDRR